VLLVLDVLREDLQTVDVGGQRREIAAWVGSPRSATSRAAPAVSPAITGRKPCSRITLRHWPRACTWLWTVVIESRDAPATPSRWNRIRRKCSAMMCRPEPGRKWWMSATRPAIELSIGIMASSASPASTTAKTSSKDAHGTASQSG